MEKSNLGKFYARNDEGIFAGYFMSSKAQDFTINALRA